MTDKVIRCSPKCLLEFCSPGHIDQEVGGGVDGEGQVGHHGQPGYEGRRVQPAGRGTTENSIIYAVIFVKMCYIAYICPGSVVQELARNKMNRSLVCSVPLAVATFLFKEDIVRTF